MTIEQQLTTKLKEAMRSKNKKEIAVLRMVKAQAGVAKVAPGFDGEAGDAFWLDMIARYVKQQKKAREEFKKVGEKGAEQVADIQFEIDYLEPYLPSFLGEDQVRELVRQAIAETGASGAKMAGRVTGEVMKQHRDAVDPGMVKRIATEELG
jgi:uncharacterized protein YqeY